MEPIIMVATSESPRYQWRQYFVITDGRCVVVEMLPALAGGWKFHSVTSQGSESWGDMSRDQIADWKRKQHVGMAPELGGFRDRLLAVAASGQVPDYR